MVLPEVCGILLFEFTLLSIWRLYKFFILILLELYVLYRFWDILRRIMACRGDIWLFKFIENGTTRWIACKWTTVHRLLWPYFVSFRDKARYRLKIVIFAYRYPVPASTLHRPEGRTGTYLVGAMTPPLWLWMNRSIIVTGVRTIQ